MSEAHPPDADSSLLANPDFRRILIVQFLFGISYSSFLLLPKHLTQNLHARPSEVGQASAFSLVAAAFLAPIVGNVARTVSRSHLLRLAFVLESASAFAFLALDHVGPILYGIRVLQGLAWAILFNTTASLTAEIVPQSKMAKAIGFLGLAMLVTNAIAPLVAEPISMLWGWNAVFLLAGFCSLIGTFSVPPSRPAEAEHLAIPPIAEGSVLPIHFASFAMGTGIGVLFTFTQPFALHVGETRVGTYFLGYVLAASIVRTVFAGFSDRIGPARAATLALCGYVVLVLTTSLLDRGWLVFLGAGNGLAHGILYPSLTASGLTRVPKEGRSTFLGWFAGAFNAGWALATLVLGRVADRHGYPAVFLIAAFSMSLALPGLAHLAYGRRRLRPHGT